LFDIVLFKLTATLRQAQARLDLKNQPAMRDRHGCIHVTISRCDRDYQTRRRQAIVPIRQHHPCLPISRDARLGRLVLRHGGAAAAVSAWTERATAASRPSPTATNRRLQKCLLHEVRSSENLLPLEREPWLSKDYKLRTQPVEDCEPEPLRRQIYPASGCRLPALPVCPPSIVQDAAVAAERG
jgi:hypothetical protein